MDKQYSRDDLIILRPERDTLRDGFLAQDTFLTDLNDLYKDHQAGRETSKTMAFTPGKAVEFFYETVTSAAMGDIFEAMGETFSAKVRYLGTKAIEGEEQRLYLVENTERGEKYEVTRDSLFATGIHEGSDADFPDEDLPVLIVRGIDVDSKIITG